MATLPALPEDVVDLTDSSLYINRELSWLDFNARVLALAARSDIPLLERCRFLAIFTRNLDEFFMVRVAGIQDAIDAGRPPSARDLMPRERVLEQVNATTRDLLAEQYRILRDEVTGALEDSGIFIVPFAELPSRALSALRRRFEREIEPVLTPLAVGPGLPFPYISPLSLNLGVVVSDPDSGDSRFARVKMPPGPRFLETSAGWVLIEEIIEGHLDRVFPGMAIDGTALFRVTRDADFSISDEADDLLGAVEAQLRRRRFGEVVRLEVEVGVPERILRELSSALDVSERDIFAMPRPLDLTALFQLANLDRPELRYRPWEPRTQARLRGDSRTPLDIFDAIRRKDILVHHPYDDFMTSVAEFVEQAGEDPDVLAIKHTLYRTSGDTPIVPALVRAAEQGKQVVCLVEVQARFDEERNIRWAKALERAGVHVVYGPPSLKTHAKLALVMRREGDRVRRYVHIGTGNYHPTTARLYTDVGLFTCDDEVTQDVADLFNFLTGFSRPPRYRQVLVAPAHIRDGLITEIRRVVEGHTPEQPGLVEIKVNGLIDGPIIEELYRASQAGVQVELLVRGICGLRPGIPGVSDNIRVTSVVGRFLEHARIFAFTVGEMTRYWIGSADVMERNLDHRVELVTPILDRVAETEVRAALDLMRGDTALAWQLGSDGLWVRVDDPGRDGSSSNSQDALMDRAALRSRSSHRG